MSKITDALNEALGRESERAAFVKWLRADAADLLRGKPNRRDVLCAEAIEELADAIERGDHQPHQGEER